MKQPNEIAYDIVKYGKRRHDADLNQKQRNALTLSLLEDEDSYELLAEKMDVMKLIKDCLEGYSNPAQMGKLIMRSLSDCMETKVENVFDEALEQYEGFECAGDIEYADTLSRTRDLQSSVWRAIA